MRSTKLVSLLLVGALSAGALVGCSQPRTAEESSQQEAASSQTATTEAEEQAGSGEAESTETGEAEASEAEAEAKQLISDLTGSYQELFPVLFEEQYEQLWLDDSAAVVGEEEAPEAVEQLQAFITGELQGKEAIEAYGEEGGPFDCSWKNGLAELNVDGDSNIISGTDAEGNDLFSGTYSFKELDGDWFVFESDDVDNADFKYFAFLPDTPDSTFHIEFRYGSDAEGLGDWREGTYAYWNAAGIQSDYTQEVVEDVINLFCTENLSE